jgi:predicted nucleic acid-binding protein
VPTDQQRRWNILLLVSALADASLVAAAETLNMKRIFSLDSDFYIYRLPGNIGFDVIP